MMKFSKIGATALALALSVTFLTPSTVLAAPERSKILQMQGSYSDEGDVIETTKERVLGPFDNYTEAYEAAKAKGYTKSLGGFKEGYRVAWDEDFEKCYIEYVTYKNTITGQTSTDEESVSKRVSEKSDDYYKFQESILIKKGETTYLAVPLKSGDTTIGKVKSSKKSVFTAKLNKKMAKEEITNETVNYDVEENADGTFTYYYRTSVGTKVILGTSKDYEAFQTALKATNNSSATRYIKLDAKKSGKANLSFKIYNNSGAETGSVKIKVLVQDDTSVFKTVTFAGKSLLDDYSKTNNINYGKSGDDITDVSTKKKGKLVVKANKNYKVVKIEVGTLYTEAKPYTGEHESGSYETTAHEVNGKTESFRYKTVKSGKKITLGTVGYDGEKENYSYNDGTTSTTRKYNVRALYAPTSIRVTYYDKITKTYERENFTIFYKATK